MEPDKLHVPNWGISYNEGYCYIKMRFTPKKWSDLNIPNGIGTVRTTKQGYILFEAKLHTSSRVYYYIYNKLC